MLAAHARELAASTGICVKLIEGDFYTVAIAGRYGAVTYWDGFGVGTDSDQGRSFVAFANGSPNTARHRYDFDTWTHDDRHVVVG